MNSCFSTSAAGAADAGADAPASALAAAVAAGAVVAPPVPVLHAASAALPPSRPAAARKLRRGTFVSAARRRISSRLSAMSPPPRFRGARAATGAPGAMSSGDENEVRRVLPPDHDRIPGAQPRDGGRAGCVLASRDDLARDIGGDPELRLVAEVRALVDPSLDPR